VIVSRGELIEIGDGFRIPDVLVRSGARLVEVGTTNRTRAKDYEKAVRAETALLLRVHQSNFRVVGFTEQPRLEELAAVCAAARPAAARRSRLGRAVGAAGEPSARESLAAVPTSSASRATSCSAGRKRASSSGVLISSSGCACIRYTARSARTSSRSRHSRERCVSISTRRNGSPCCGCCARTELPCARGPNGSLPLSAAPSRRRSRGSAVARCARGDPELRMRGRGAARGAAPRRRSARRRHRARRQAPARLPHAAE